MWSENLHSIKPPSKNNMKNKDSMARSCPSRLETMKIRSLEDLSHTHEVTVKSTYGVLTTCKALFLKEEAFLK